MKKKIKKNPKNLEIKVTFRLSVADYEIFKKEAERERMSVSCMLRRYVAHQINFRNRLFSIVGKTED